MKGRITKRLVDETFGDNKPVFVFDTELAGFVLKVTPSGRKTYQFRYRMGGRNTVLKTYTLGQHGPLTPNSARKLAQTLLGDVRRGVDPATERAAKRAEARGEQSVSTLSDVFLDVYGSTKLGSRTLTEYRRAFDQQINPRFGRMKAREVSHSDVERLHHSMKATPVAANRTIAALSKFFSWAIRAGHRPDRQNPCSGLQKFREEARQRYLSAAEIAQLGRAISTCEHEDRITPWHAALFRCLLLTGMRRSELATLRWQDVNLDRRVIVLPDSKVGRRDVPIAREVMQILETIPRVHGNPHIFVGSKQAQPVVNLAKPWSRVVKEAGIAPTRIHDLRHSAASVAIATGASLPLIGGVLGHKSQQTTQRYAHLSDDPVRKTSEAMAQHINKYLRRLSDQ